MTPKEAYDHTLARARLLLRLHDGLINVRQRRARRDWRESFCRLMHWPVHSPIERVDSRDALIVLREGAALTPEDFSADALDDLLRSSLAFGVSALDRYVHERVVKGIISALKASELNRRQQDFSIPAVLALQAADAVRRAAKDGQKARPANEVRNRIQTMLHLRPFQSWRQIEDAYELIGVTGLAGTLQQGYGVGNFKPIKDQLNTLVEKRNYIVHEGDLVRHQRGGVCRKNEISKRYVADSLDFLDGLVTQLEQVA